MTSILTFVQTVFIPFKILFVHLRVQRVQITSLSGKKKKFWIVDCGSHIDVLEKWVSK